MELLLIQFLIVFFITKKGYKLQTWCANGSSSLSPSMNCWSVNSVSTQTLSEIWVSIIFWQFQDQTRPEEAKKILLYFFLGTYTPFIFLVLGSWFLVCKTPDEANHVYLISSWCTTSPLKFRGYQLWKLHSFSIHKHLINVSISLSETNDTVHTSPTTPYWKLEKGMC